jgi:hypothetical protein
MLRLTLILLSILTIPVRANLGETVKQCLARYGQPMGYSEANDKSPFGTVGFTAGPYTLVVFLIDTTEVGARISKKDKSAFTDAEMQAIMAADSNGSPWTSTSSDDPTCLRWTRADKATVLYDQEKHILIFTSEAMAKAVASKPAKPDAGH